MPRRKDAADGERGAPPKCFGVMRHPALSAMGFRVWAVGHPLMGVASREPNLEGTSPSPIPVAASPSGQLRIVDDSGGRLHRVGGGGDKSVEMEMNTPAERAGKAGVCG